MLPHNDKGVHCCVAKWSQQMHPWLNKPGLAVAKSPLTVAPMALVLDERPVSKRVEAGFWEQHG